MSPPKKKRKVPVTNHELENGITMKPVYCVNTKCGKFLCYEAIETGMIHHPCGKCKRTTQVSILPVENDEPPEKMIEVRCGKCGRFLYSEALIKGTVKSKCRGCGEWNNLVISEDTTVTPKLIESVPLDIGRGADIIEAIRSNSPASPR